MARPESIRVFAPAKLNLFLHVGAKRADGFHALESFVVFAECGDRLTFAPSDVLELKVTGLFAKSLPAFPDNLVLKAAHLLEDGRGATITLEKNLPVASGLGGGSADAAAALRGLNLLWELNKSEEELMEIGARLGSDVPVCVVSSPAFVEGRGDVITKAPRVATLPLILVNPNVMLSTVDVFGRLKARSGIGQSVRQPASLEKLWDVAAYLQGTQNDLEEPACELAPAIDEVMDALLAEGAEIAQMSGSGATCFGIFSWRGFALSAAEALAHEHHNWWVRATRIAEPGIGQPQWNGDR